MSPAISLRGVGKRYRLVEGEPVLLKQVAKALTGRRSTRELWALRDVDLEVAPGESIGVIGRNGSGKTTMLRLLAGVSAPTVGHLRVQGSVAPLIGVGVGFNPELTGRENVLTNGRILGLSRQQLERDFDEIVAFAELEDFVQTPVKYYSSGMFLRLAFAVAIQVRPEVLLVDEVLAVGDLAFQAKCLERMNELRRAGTTIVVVTHNLGMLGRICDRAVVLSKGQKRFDGDVDEALGAYHAIMREEQAARESPVSMLEQQGNEVLFQGGADVTADVIGPTGEATNTVEAGSPITLRVSARFDVECTDPLLGFAVAAGPYGNVYMAHTLPGDHHGTYGPGRPLEADIRLRTPLLAGSYHATVQVTDNDGSAALGISPPAPFYVRSGARATGAVDLGAEVSIGNDVVALGADETARHA